MSLIRRYLRFSTNSQALPKLWQGHLTTCRKCALEARNKYAQKLHPLMLDRDISAELLRNGSTIPVELAKFKVYGPKLDIYSFRDEFEKD